MVLVQEVGCPPDQLEVDAVATFFFHRERPVDGAAGLLDKRLGHCLTHHLETEDQEQHAGQLLVKATANVAASWVLFCPAGYTPPDNEADVVVLLKDTLKGCVQSGFTRVAIAPPVQALKYKKLWLDCLGREMEGWGAQLSECLVTFDDSYLHDHSAPVLNI